MAIWQAEAVQEASIEAEFQLNRMQKKVKKLQAEL